MENDLLDSIVKAYFAQINSALKISEIVSSHGGEEELSPDSIIIGLIYRLMVPMTNEEIKDSMESTDGIINEIFYSDEEDDGGDEGDGCDEGDEGIDGVNDIINTSTDIRKVKTNHCNCDICCKARVCLLNFHSHEANDQLAQKFKDSISEACIKNNLVI